MPHYLAERRVGDRVLILVTLTLVNGAQSISGQYCTGTLITWLIGGATAAVVAAADFSAEKRKAQINPFYFLWRAKHG